MGEGDVGVVAPPLQLAARTATRTAIDPRILGIATSRAGAHDNTALALPFESRLRNRGVRRDVFDVTPEQGSAAVA
jgi:hypothetical protein